MSSSWRSDSRSGTKLVPLLCLSGLALVRCSGGGVADLPSPVALRTASPALSNIDPRYPCWRGLIEDWSKTCVGVDSSPSGEPRCAYDPAQGDYRNVCTVQPDNTKCKKDRGYRQLGNWQYTRDDRSPNKVTHADYGFITPLTDISTDTRTIYGQRVLSYQDGLSPLPTDWKYDDNTCVVLDTGHLESEIIREINTSDAMINMLFDAARVNPGVRFLSMLVRDEEGPAGSNTAAKLLRFSMDESPGDGDMFNGPWQMATADEQCATDDLQLHTESDFSFSKGYQPVIHYKVDWGRMLADGSQLSPTQTTSFQLQRLDASIATVHIRAGDDPTGRDCNSVTSGKKWSTLKKGQFVWVQSESSEDLSEDHVITIKTWSYDRGVVPLGTATLKSSNPGCGAQDLSVNCFTYTVSGCWADGVDVAQRIGDQDTLVKAYNPTATNIGTVVLLTGGDSSGGVSSRYYENLPYPDPSGAYPKALISDLRNKGYKVVEAVFPAGWNVDPNGAGLKFTSCRVSTVLKYIHDGMRASGKSFAALGVSGGAGALAYGLAHYDLGKYLDKVVMSGGPVMTDLTAACSPAVDTFSGSDAFNGCGFTSQNGRGLDFTGDTGAKAVVARSYGYSGDPQTATTCLGTSTPTALQSYRFALHSHLMYSNGLTSYPTTELAVLLGTNEPANSAAPGQGRLWMSKVSGCNAAINCASTTVPTGVCVTGAGHPIIDTLAGLNALKAQFPAAGISRHNPG